MMQAVWNIAVYSDQPALAFINSSHDLLLPLATWRNSNATWRVSSERERCTEIARRCCCVLGVRTGRCMTAADKPDKKACEIYGWCPVEQDELPLYVLQTIVHFSEINFQF